LHNEERHNLCIVPNIISVIKPMIIKWTGDVSRRGMMIQAKFQLEI